MPTNIISVRDTDLIQIRLVESRGLGHITVNERQFAIKEGATLDITPSLREGDNIATFFIDIDWAKDSLIRLIPVRRQWMGRFEIYINREIASSYFRQGICYVGSGQKTVAAIEINVVKEVSKPTVMQLINHFQKVEGITSANKADFPKSNLHMVFGNGLAVHVWKNYIGVQHVFISDHSRQCVYGGYVGWIHTGDLNESLESLREEFGEEIL